jgi:glycosyltransferase involved in cell wall biosynthesis
LYPERPHPTVSVVICALNEEKNLPNVLPYIPSWVDEVILMDGHSTDNTIKIAKELRPDIRVLYQPHKGKGEALKYGVAASKSEIIVTLDADGTYPPEEMSGFVRALVAGSDFAKGTRFFGQKVDSMTGRRLLGNKILALESNFLFNTHYTDVCSGYYAFRKKLFHEIPLASDGFELEQELFVKIARRRYNVAEIPHSYKKRLHGTSKTRDFKQGIKNVLMILSLWFNT